MTQLQTLNSIKQEANDDSSSNQLSSPVNTKTSESGFDDLTQNLDFAERLQLLASSGRLASSKISVKTKFDKKATDILKNWLIKNIDNPYPSDEVKEKLCEMTGLNKKQIQNWFTNTRKRYVQPLKRKLRNGALTNEVSSETGGSQNDQDSVSATKFEDNLQKRQASPTVESIGTTNVTTTPTTANLMSSTMAPSIFQISHVPTTPTIIFPNHFSIVSPTQSNIISSIPFGGVTHHQTLQIPQVSYTSTIVPQTFQIDRNLLNYDHKSYTELQKEAETREKALKAFMINESLKVALQVMRQEKLNKFQISTDLSSCLGESEETKLRNKQRRQDLEAYLHQITKRVHVA